MDAQTGRTMSKAQQWIVLGLVAALALGVGGWALLVSPKRAEAALVREQAAVQTVANQRSETHLEVLAAKQAQVPEREAYLEEVSVRIPDDERMPDLLRSLSSAADGAGVQLVSVVPGTATAVAAPAPPAAPAAGAAPVPAPAVAPAPPTAVPPAAEALQAVPLTMEVTGGFYEIEQFVAVLEDLPRAVRLTGVSLVVGDDAAAGRAVPVAGRSLRTTVTALVFVRGAAAQDVGTSAATGAAGAASPTATPTGTAPAAGASAETTS